MTTKTVEDFFSELWDVVSGAAKDAIAHDDVRAGVRDLVEYAARAQWVIATSPESELKELAKREFEHRTAQIEGELAVFALEATKKERLTGVLQGLFGLLLKYGPAILK